MFSLFFFGAVKRLQCLFRLLRAVYARAAGEREREREKRKGNRTEILDGHSSLLSELFKKLEYSFASSDAVYAKLQRSLVEPIEIGKRVAKQLSHMPTTTKRKMRKMKEK